MNFAAIDNLIFASAARATIAAAAAAARLSSAPSLATVR
jgi:hypothetical protein